MAIALLQKLLHMGHPKHGAYDADHAVAAAQMNDAADGDSVAKLAVGIDVTPQDIQTAREAPGYVAPEAAPAAPAAPAE